MAELSKCSVTAFAYPDLAEDFFFSSRNCSTLFNKSNESFHLKLFFH